MAENVEKTMNKIVSLCKRRGFIFRDLKYTEVLPILGIMVLWELNLRETLRIIGGKRWSMKETM